MDIKPTLLVLAAGMGSRYGSLKQLDPIGRNGETIIDYSIYDAVKAGFGKVVFVIRKSIEKEFIEVYVSKYKDIIELDYVFQELENLPKGFSLPKGRTKPWGTVHAVLMAKDIIKEPFLVINGDDFYGADTYKVCSQFFASISNLKATDYCMPAYLLKDTLSLNGSVSRGICAVNQTHLQKIVEHTKIFTDGLKIWSEDINGTSQPLAGDAFCSMNMFGFLPSVFEYIEQYFIQFLEKNIHNLKSEFYFPLLLNWLLEEKKITLKVIDNNADWFGITYKEDKAAALERIDALVLENQYPQPLWG